MASKQMKIRAERLLRQLLDEEGLIQPDEVEYGDSCVRFLWHERKVVVVLDVDEEGWITKTRAGSARQAEGANLMDEAANGNGDHGDRATSGGDRGTIHYLPLPRRPRRVDGDAGRHEPNRPWPDPSDDSDLGGDAA